MLRLHPITMQRARVLHLWQPRLPNLLNTTLRPLFLPNRGRIPAPRQSVQPRVTNYLEPALSPPGFGVPISFLDFALPDAGIATGFLHAIVLPVQIHLQAAPHAQDDSMPSQLCRSLPLFLPTPNSSLR